MSENAPNIRPLTEDDIEYKRDLMGEIKTVKNYKKLILWEVINWCDSNIEDPNPSKIYKAYSQYVGGPDSEHCPCKQSVYNWISEFEDKGLVTVDQEEYSVSGQKTVMPNDVTLSDIPPLSPPQKYILTIPIVTSVSVLLFDVLTGYVYHTRTVIAVISMFSLVSGSVLTKLTETVISGPGKTSIEIVLGRIKSEVRDLLSVIKDSKVLYRH